MNSKQCLSFKLPLLSQFVPVLKTNEMSSNRTGVSIHTHSVFLDLSPGCPVFMLSDPSPYRSLGDFCFWMCLAPCWRKHCSTCFRGISRQGASSESKGM